MIGFHKVLLIVVLLVLMDSPPNTPQRHRNIERARERQERMLESPEHRRTPQNPAVGGGVPFILPFPIPPPVAPLQIPQGPVGDDPFVKVLYNGQILHLTPGMAAQVGNLQNQAHAAPLAAPPPLFPPAAMVDVNMGHPNQNGIQYGHI
ncbi:uncharacterized protein LACBIDRAFT_309902 [Laccaria bicolor S238N-H82]|uniref:Predicted protein n=1 Tax=Laccaria bicolor (strain S238N-H82 / ATCC MYA-4686) TaxID=486041 RepID=B0DTB7_LACBS|nr:uncharacterized protein LACBIDRAFT_309902 [Laccaria bicolor S238N-H82]EDR02193.1 predicted protein [Laccaria bicolor S238N-H82]|eukprot:XP_001887138.1 predicted protein [Laccaria bicolor S238N-H82]